jgi:hypothetical protein
VQRRLLDAHVAIILVQLEHVHCEPAMLQLLFRSSRKHLLCGVAIMFALYIRKLRQQMLVTPMLTVAAVTTTITLTLTATTTSTSSSSSITLSTLILAAQAPLLLLLQLLLLLLLLLPLLLRGCLVVNTMSQDY